MSHICKCIRYLSFWLLAAGLASCRAPELGDATAFTPSPVGSVQETPTVAPTLTPTGQMPVLLTTQELTATGTLTPTLTASPTLSPTITVDFLPTATWTPALTAREPEPREQKRKADGEGPGG